MEEQVDHLEELEGLNSELDGFISDLKGREEGYSARIAELESGLAEAKAQADMSAARLAKQEAILSAALHEARSMLVKETSKAAALSSERNDLASKLETVSRLLDEERGRSAEKDIFISSSRSAIKDKEAESEKIWKAMEELKTELAAERAAVKDRELKLQKSSKAAEALEQRLEAAARDAERSEQGFQLKIDLVKKELREQTLRGEELARSLAAAGARLDEALDEAEHREKLLAEARAALAEKEALLKAANQKIRALTKEAEDLRGGRGRENTERSREITAALTERVSELETALSENAAESLEKFRASQSALSDSQSALRKKEEENASLRAREGSLLKDIQDAEEKWKLSAVQLHNAVSKLRAAENDNEIMAGRVKTLESERDKFRAAAIKAEATAAALAAEESKARDGEAAGMLAALEEQSAKYAELLKKYDDAVLANEAAARESSAVRAESEALRARLKAAESGVSASAEAERARSAGLLERLREAEGRLKRAEVAIEEERSLRAAAEAEAGQLRSLANSLESGAAGASEAERVRSSGLLERLRAAEAGLKKAEITAEEDRSLRAAAESEAAQLRSMVKALESGAAGSTETERARMTELFERLKAAEAGLKKAAIDLEGEKAARAVAAGEAAELRELVATLEAEAAGAAEHEKERFSKLSERMHNADAMLKKKEFELEEARSALAALDGECEMLRGSRSALGQKYASEIKAENELVSRAQAQVAERDEAIERLSAAEGELREEAEALKTERKELLALLKKKASNDASAKLRDAEKLIAENEGRLTKLRLQLETAAAEKAELESREKELREQLEAKPYRAMLREAEEKLFIKERMLSELNARMKKLGGDFEELKKRGPAASGPGYMPEFEELVAGLGHQIANSISIIRSHAEFCAESPDAEGATESLSVIVRNIVALQRKIDTIMNFSRPVIPQRSPERLAAVASETLESLKAAGRLDRIRTRVEAPNGLRPINVDRVRMAAAVEQLLLNAAEAMPAGGQLTLKLSSSGGRQRLEVTDTGEGIEKKNIGTVFHPFFTTRPGKMGLGLTLARNVAKAHGGTLELRSEPGRGTKAVLELPEA
jgi:signal transduction histidine kinase